MMNGSLFFGPTIRLYFIPTVSFCQRGRNSSQPFPGRVHMSNIIQSSIPKRQRVFVFLSHCSDQFSVFCTRFVFQRPLSVCYLRISPSFSKMNPFFSALVLCLCFLAVSTAPEKNSAKSGVHDGKLSDKEHYDKDGKHNEEYDHEAFLGKEKKSFDQLTPEESKERLG